MMDNNSSPIDRLLLAASVHTRCCYNITRLLSLVMAIIISKSLVALCAATQNLDQPLTASNHHNHNQYHHHHHHINNNLPLPAIPVPEALLSRPREQQQQDHADKVHTINYTILKGDNVTFECSLEHHEADHAVWMFQENEQDMPMFLAAKRSVTQDLIYNKFLLTWTDSVQRLTLHNVQPNDKGVYVCQIQNSNTRLNKPKTRFILSVAIKPTIEKIIEHIKSPSSGSPSNNEYTITHTDDNKFTPVLEYDSKSDSEIGLSCIATSEPAPQYRWYKYQLPRFIENLTDKQSVTMEEPGGWREISLTEQINKISINDPIQDSTLYRCQANNTFGVAEHTIEVRIKAPPKIYGKKYGTEIHYAPQPLSGVLLTCRGRVYPDSSHIEKYWSKDSVRLDPSQNDDQRFDFSDFVPAQEQAKSNELTSNERHQLPSTAGSNNQADQDSERINQWIRMRSQQTDIIMTLKITSLQDSDFGNYTCHVSSQQNNGEDSHTFYLSGAPSQVKLVSGAISEHPDKYQLKWQVDTYQPVIKHIIYYRLAKHERQHHQDESWTQIVLPLEDNHRTPSYNLALTSPTNLPTALESIQQVLNSNHQLQQQQQQQQQQLENRFEYTITNLSKTTIYEVKVEAENKRGSIQSSVLQFATPDSSSISSYFHSAATKTVAIRHSQLLLVSLLMAASISLGRWL